MTAVCDAPTSFFVYSDDAVVAVVSVAVAVALLVLVIGTHAMVDWIKMRSQSRERNLARIDKTALDCRNSLDFGLVVVDNIAAFHPN